MDTSKRFWEVDFLRGVAVALMIVSNTVTDLGFFRLYADANSVLWTGFTHITASIFITLVGVSLALSYSKAEQSGKKNLYRKYVKRGLKIFSWGLIITLVTWVFIRESFIAFGALHLIGISIILACPFLKCKKFISIFLVLGLVFIFASGYVQSIATDSYLLLWLGIAPATFQSVDYFPLFPWFGLVLIGIFLGNLFYPNYKRAFKIRNFSGFLPARFFCFLGRHSLFIYLLHQPVIIALLVVFGFVGIGSII